MFGPDKMGDIAGETVDIVYLSYISNQYRKSKTKVATLVACVAGGSGYPRELRSRTRVQKAAQVARRMGRSLAEF